MATTDSIIDLITKYYGYSYIMPLVCSFGIICNIINLTVLTNRRLKESPYSYLTGLACSDLLALSFTFTTTFTRGHWLITPPGYVPPGQAFKSTLTTSTTTTSSSTITTNEFYNSSFLIAADLVETSQQQQQKYSTEYWLKKLERRLFLPSANFFSAMSVSITVALTIERYLFIKFPMHASGFCSPKNARYIIVILTYFVFFFRLPMYFFSDAIYVYSSSPSSNANSLAATTNFTADTLKEDNSSSSSWLTTMTAMTTIRTISGVKIEKYYEGFQKFYFLMSFVLFEIVPFFTLSILNWNLILLVKNSIREFEHLRNNVEECNESLLASEMMKKSKNTNSEYNFILHQTKDLETVNETEDLEHVKKFCRSDLDLSSSSRFNQMSASQSFTSKPSAASLALKRISVNQQLRVNKRRKDQLKLTRTLIAVVCITLLSEISSIITYDKITEFLIANHFKDYMKRIYPFQVFISNMITLALHSLNFFLYCAFNKKYLDTFRQTYAVCFKYLKYLKCKASSNQTVNQSISLCRLNKY